jgi:hypothetical protein
MKSRPTISKKIQLMLACIIAIYFFYFGILTADYSKNPEWIVVANFALMIFSLIILYIVSNKFSNSLLPSLIIIITLYLGYVLKLHILLYLLTYESSSEFDFINNAYKLELPLLNTPEIIDKYHVILCAAFLAATFFLYLQTKPVHSRKNDSFYNLKIDSNVNKNKIHITMWMAVIFYILTTIVVLNTGVGFTSGDPDLVVKLPFRLAGVIQSILNFVLPTIFVLILYYALLSRDSNLIKKAIATLYIFSISATLITTSKAYMYIGFFSLFLMLIFFNGLTKKIAIYIIISVILFAFFSTVASVFRIIRVLEPGIGFAEIPARAIEYWDWINTEELEHKPVYSNLGFLLRFNGADSLLNVISWNRLGGQISFIDYIVMDYPRAINQFFSEAVLGLPPTAGLSFSPSLLGFYYILFSSNIGLIFFLFAYFILWNTTFYLMRKICATDFLLLLTPLLTSVVFFTSEGTLETIYRSIFGLLIIAIFIRNGSKFYRN